MSRSRRHTPMMGITTSRSDKPFKRDEHGRERVALRKSLAHGDDGHVPVKAFGNPWSAPKDGKQWVGAWCDRARWMRK